MATFRCEVVPVKLEPHPNADSLSLVKVWGYTVVVKTADWEGLDRGVYIPPDSVIPFQPRFAFLFSPDRLTRWEESGSEVGGLTTRITVHRFRGVYSEGLLVPLEKEFECMAMGTDRAPAWGITHYEPPIKYQTRGQAVPATPGPPGLVIPTYGVENFKRYGDCIPAGTPVYVTEKIHGCSARYVYAGVQGWNREMFVGSRTSWKAYSQVDPWNQCLKQNPWIEGWCRAYPDGVLYGEVFGQVQDLKYGAKNGELFFRAFDVWNRGRWLNYAELEGVVSPEHRAPVVFLGPFDEKLVRKIAERDSVICPGQCAEGVVICPLVEMDSPIIGRVQLKIVSNRYLERAK